MDSTSSHIEKEDMLGYSIGLTTQHLFFSGTRVFHLLSILRKGKPHTLYQPFKITTMYPFIKKIILLLFLPLLLFAGIYEALIVTYPTPIHERERNEKAGKITLRYLSLAAPIPTMELTRNG